MSNEIKLYFQNIFYNFIYLFLAGTVLQTFLLECGFSENTVNVYFSVMQMVQLGVMLLFSKKMDSVKNVIKAVSLTYLPGIPLVLYLIFMGKLGQNEITWALIIVYAFSVLFNAGHGLYTALCYKLPYHIMDMKNYGKITARSGLIIGIVSTVFSYLLTFFVDKFHDRYFVVMTCVYIFCLMLIPAFFLVTKSMKKVGVNVQTEKPSEKKEINIFTYKPFYVLALPNFLRGFCMGITNLIVTVGYHENILDAKSASVVLVLLNVFTAVSCLLYPFISKKLKEYRMIPLFSLGVAVFLVCMFAFKGTTMFLIMYALMFFSRNLIDYAIPVAVTQIVDYDVMGQYSSWRMLLNAGGIIVAGFVCIPMLKAFGAVASMIVTGGAMILCGMTYYIYMKKNLPENMK